MSAADAAPAADVINTAGGAISNRRVSVLSGSPLEVTRTRSTYSPGGTLGIR